ncbi:MAG TPA: hypothetical protein VFP44_20795 [Usitatibacter sp.]|nr:hypothetical protein [Usitatibacter sp.]
MKRLLVFPLLLLANAAFADLYDRPYSIIETDPSRAADYLVMPVIVNRVDGKNAQYGNRAIVDPGPHDVTIDVRPRKGFHIATQATFPLETKACMRYYVSAKLDSPTSQRWQPVVRHAEPIGECQAKFNIAGAK